VVDETKAVLFAGGEKGDDEISDTDRVIDVE
jgi:hypothetical protein